MRGRVVRSHDKRLPAVGIEESPRLPIGRLPLSLGAPTCATSTLPSALQGLSLSSPCSVRLAASWRLSLAAAPRTARPRIAAESWPLLMSPGSPTPTAPLQPPLLLLLLLPAAMGVLAVVVSEPLAARQPLASRASAAASAASARGGGMAGAPVDTAEGDVERQMGVDGGVVGVDRAKGRGSRLCARL